MHFRSRREIASDIIKTSNTVSEITDRMPSLYRSPHGHKSLALKSVLKKLGLQLIPWTKGIWDTDGSDSSVLMKRFAKRFDDLEILLLHDGIDENIAPKNRNETVKVLPEIIAEYRRHGYEFRKISEL